MLRLLRLRDERGVVLPSPVVMLSILAVAMAAFAFVATRGGESPEREVATVSQPGATSTPAAKPSKEPKKPKVPPVKRGKVYVEVYNNSGITGLAGRVAGTAGSAGWQVVGTDNWYGGNIPANTVYYPRRLERAGKLLALDLGIDRAVPAVDPMRLDRLTVILTGEL
ncbi:LytR C-terminal domain-containing protein [Nocardioides ferulae]|uniref:LytR C-terminal domain-containing protein n=1 Tax=Nocardioides ferulae TaxID=2340821 RepID=UPI001F0C6239|nr:LytR C-terminal domain-containing protein [Nocardioides ferulae]